MAFSDKIDSIQSSFQEEVSSAKTTKDLDQIQVHYLGKKGPVQSLMQELKTCSKEEKPLAGKLINQLKASIANQIEQRKETLVEIELQAKLAQEQIDVTLPGRRKRIGRLHPSTQMMNKALDVLINMGFSVECGPDIDSDYYNFEALNFPPDHPAREMQDTFYITSDLLLRTHTSNVQTRIMEKFSLPIRVVAPGRCFRNETISARSHVFFHQIEGFYIDENVTFADLLATIDQFWKKLFDSTINVRFRPSYFPFVEPGLEVDIECTKCKGKGCKICKQTGWLEVAGAGMIHPNVLQSGGIDPEKYTGFAWGMGIERLAMLEFGINDIRMFTENDMRFLQQFP